MTEPIKASELPGLVGREIEPSSWLEVTQERVNQFAAATNDHQFIHVDPEKAAKTPFRGTIDPRILPLSLISYLIQEKAAEIEGVVMGINYGSDKVRFLAPVRVGSRIRAHQKLIEATEKSPGQWLLKNLITIEIENEKKPALIAETLGMIVVR